MARYYAGIGSRETPEAYLGWMELAAIKLGLQGMTLRSGAADGADTAFERGAVSAKTGKKDAPDPEIYVPWVDFNKASDHRQDARFLAKDQITSPELSGQAVVISREHHPNWANLKPAVRWMHARNVAQVLGMDCQTPSEFVLCWTPGGSGGGGTGQAIRIARAHDIPVYDLGAYNAIYVRKRLADKHGVQI